MSKEKLGQAGALLISVGLAYAGINDVIPYQRVVKDEQNELYEQKYKESTMHFLQLCEKNDVVTTNQKLEKFKTFGGEAQPDPYIQAFDQIIRTKSEQMKKL